MMRRKSTGAEVLASTAGDDTWKTWAGRSHGSEGFELFDLFRGAKRKFNAKFIWGIPPAGTACPVCMMVPDSKADWHVTSACGHATCRDCLQGYASSLVRDPSHHGPLKCPVCPLPLRPKDAVKALGGDAQLLQLWDKKIRDEVLRALPGFRHCPRCNNNDNDNANNLHDNTNNDDGEEIPKSALMGGGFVTPECLAPVNKRRERRAMKWLNHPGMKSQTLVWVYAVYLILYSWRFSFTDIFVDLINVSIAPLWFLWRMWRLARHIVAFEARKALFAPIKVECPCCNEAFILNAESELGNNVITDEATKKWIGSNTRACPSCSVPISKIDGCNHMQCGHCRSHFCWACMRIGSSCKAYDCNNGAPFGNAGAEGADAEVVDETGILDRVDSIANDSCRLDSRDGATLAVILLGILARESPLVKMLARFLVTSFAVIFSSGSAFALLLLYVMVVMGRNGRRIRFRDIVDGTATEGLLVEELFDVNNAVERRLINEAMRRSMIEQ